MEEKLNHIADYLKNLHSKLDHEGIVTDSEMEEINWLIGVVDEALAICPTNEVDTVEKLIEWKYMLNGLQIAD